MCYNTIHSISQNQIPIPKIDIGSIFGIWSSQTHFLGEIFGISQTCESCLIEMHCSDFWDQDFWFRNSFWDWDLVLGDGVYCVVTHIFPISMVLLWLCGLLL